jgi:hypothetical protein
VEKKCVKSECVNVVHVSTCVVVSDAKNGLFVHLVNMAAGPARTSDAAVVATLSDAAVATGCTGCDCLPDDLAVVAETELVGTVAHY